MQELVGLDIADVNFDQNMIRVLGKGSKDRIVPIGACAVEAIQIWLARRHEWAAADEAALFVTKRGGRPSTRTIQKRIEIRAMQQGISRYECIPTCYAIHSQRMFWNQAAIFERFRSFSVTPIFRQPRSTHTWTSVICRKSMIAHILVRKRSPSKFSFSRDLTDIRNMHTGNMQYFRDSVLIRKIV